MSQWTADFANDPNNNYELIIEILHNGQDVGVIKHGKNGLELVLFPHGSSFSIPFDWLLGLMNEANNKLI
ncbi:MAG TPA: hypothetical protein VJJ26_03020 [Candidatus Babeliales bacterium]|nr:hypothetical protein [Candidatus Babeliales bacterium]